MADPKSNTLTKEVFIHARLKKLADEDPNREAFVFYDKDMTRTAMTRGEVWDKSTRFAAVLHRMGIGKGDIVCNTLVNSRERLISTYGVVLAGAISMHGQILLADGEDIIRGWKESRCKAIILKSHEKGGATGALERLKDTDQDTDGDNYKCLPNLSHVIRVDFGENNDTESWLESLNNETETYVDETVTMDDVIFILTTSGSTGYSKLVPHTNRTISNAARAFVELLEARPDSTVFNSRSLGWIGGLPVVYHTMGSTRVLMDATRGHPENIGLTIARVLEAEKCDTTLILPADIQAVLNTLDDGVKLTSHIRVLATGGGPVSAVTMGAIGRFTECVKVLYGASEFGVVCGANVKDPNTYQNCCVGYVLDFVDVKILDENMEEVPTGENGEIYIRAPTLTKGYLSKEQSTGIFLEDGWFCTSDIGLFNEKGELFVYCRKNNAINHRGTLLYPGWMESRINKHPGVQKAIVLGIPDSMTMDDDICLCVIKSSQGNDLTGDQLKDYCKNMYAGIDEELKPIPKNFLFFNSYPLNNNGKIDRRAIKAEALKRLEISA